MERVLVVDDEPEALEVLGWELSDLGCDVRTASGVQEAIEIGEEFAPTVVLTDYFLRDRRTGVDVIRTLADRNPDLRAIVITGMQIEPIEEELSSVRPVRSVSVIRKPFEWATVLARLQLTPGGADTPHR